MVLHAREWHGSIKRGLKAENMWSFEEYLLTSVYHVEKCSIK
jgi:hypothetical protein